ncbi:hypothetical protein GCM10028801_10280 [Nocardioides maradonensis]
MMRISEPGDIGRVLRFAGRLGHQASLGAAGLRDVADVVRALAISLVLDAHGGWISVRELGRGCGPGVEVLAFDRPGSAETPSPEPWPHLHSQLESLGALGAAVRVEHTLGGGTAVWARITERSDDDPRPAGMPTLDVAGLIQAPPGDVRAGWSAARYGDRLGILICEAPPDSRSAAATQELLRAPSRTTPDDLWEAHGQLLGRFVQPLGDGAAALVDIDLAQHTVRATGSGSVALTVLVDGHPASGEDTAHWERSLSLLAHTAGIRPGAAGLDDTAPAALSVATLMREHREPTATACVVAARIVAPN